MTMDYLLRSINLLNILLVAAAVAAAHYIVSPNIDKEMNFPPPVAKAAPAVDQKQKAGSEPAVPPIDFMVIAEQNLFHPERKIPAENPQAQPPPPKPELVLYGTLINDNTRLAYVDDLKAPVTTPGRGKRLRVLRIGDLVGDFTLKEIHPDRIVLARGNEVMTVDLAELKGKRQNPAPPSAPATAPKPETSPNVRRRPEVIDQRFRPDRVDNPADNRVH
jgi:hypothetical protein